MIKILLVTSKKKMVIFKKIILKKNYDFFCNYFTLFSIKLQYIYTR